MWKIFLSTERLRVWQDAAASCGLQEVEISRRGMWGFELKARAGPMKVQIRDAGLKKTISLIVVEVPGPPGFHSVRICSESWNPLELVPEIAIGDPSFDSTFFIEESMRLRLVLALLDAETRRLLSRASTRSGLEISHGALRANVYDSEVPHVLPLLLDIGRRFAQPRDIPRRLAENSHRDPEAGVRFRNLVLLVRDFPGNPATLEALRTACSDPSPHIRLLAAKELGAEGRDVLLELAESEVDDGLSARAVSFLGRELPFERATALLDKAWSTGRLQTALACLEVLGRGGAAAVDPLAEVLALQNVELATAAAKALGATGNPAAEPPLILALQREQDDLRAAAANALGRVGSVAAVLPLKEAVERSRLDLDFRRAARQAIAEIQSRIHGASPGQLSLAGAEVGQLSLAQAEAGQLSLATDAGGQLSLPSGEPGQLSLGEDEES
jgi:hypothetical protein